MKLRKNYEISLFVVACILINYAGKGIANHFVLPFWLDAVGTAFCAYVLGPVCGGIVGAASHLIFSLSFHNGLFYILTNIAIGVIVGLCAKKGFFEDIFGVLTTAFLVTIFSVALSVPVNFIIGNGMIGNVWGDGVVLFLKEIGWNPAISVVIGQFYLDFVDKVITVLILFLVIRLYRKINKSYKTKLQKNQKSKNQKQRGWKNQNQKQRNQKQKKRKLRSVFSMLLLLLTVFTATFSENRVKAEEETLNQKPEEELTGQETQEESPGEKMVFSNFNGYNHTIYNGENGLPGGASNDIAQTKDGILWIGTYGGLYRYSGNTFEWMNEFESVKTVNCLYTDESGRLWIGTNDDGISICINQEITNVVDREDGLPSNSVRCITESSNGYYYVGTTDSLVILSLSGGLKVYDTIPEILYAKSISADKNGNVAVVTNEGDFFLVRGTKVIATKRLNRENETYNCCTFDLNGTLYLGTTKNNIEIIKISGEELVKVSQTECGTLAGINSVYISEEGQIFLCADNGAGYLDQNGEYCSINTRNFNSSIDYMLMDYQGNLWFTSSRLGLLRMCPTVFSEIYEEAGLPEAVVNTIIKWQGNICFGTDSGIDIVDENHKVVKEYPLFDLLEGVRIRCFMVDSKNNLWICTSSKGVLRVAPDYSVTSFDSTQGALGDKFRSAIERKDKTIAVAGDLGITLIKDDEVTDVIGLSDGLVNPKVLSLFEQEDGSLLAGTDGNGIAVIKDGKIINLYNREDGLSSDVILRMVPDRESEGLFVVTGNGLCYMDENNEIRSLDNFPYFDNYDVIVGEEELFVLSSAGIFVVDREDLLQGKKVTFELLDSKKGLRIGLIANSWNYTDENNNLYLCGDRGAVLMNLTQYDVNERNYRILLQTIEIDGEKYVVEKGEPISIPRGTKKIEFFPEVVNYTIDDPDIRIYLEGFDGNVVTVPQSELSSVVYTNLPSKDFVLHVSVLDSRNGKVMAENIYRIEMETEICDYWWFRLYVGIVAVITISYLTWLFFRTQIQKTLRIQKMQLELVQKQLQMGNETIFTIAQAVDAKDVNTSQHSTRVSEYSVMIAKKLGFSEEACEDLRKIAMLHDIGKIGIPDSILNKPAKLTDEEYEIMKSHVVRGGEILKNFSLIGHVTDGALYHHERYDGKGYVHGLKGEEIPINARIIGIADAFDAMTANRVYRKKLDMDYVIGELKKGRGTQFDPKLVDILLGLIEDGTVDVEQIYGVANGKE